MVSPRATVTRLRRVADNVAPGVKWSLKEALYVAVGYDGESQAEGS